MAATPRIIVVGGGLAGLSAIIKIAESGPAIDSLNRSTNQTKAGEVR